MWLWPFHPLTPVNALPLADHGVQFLIWERWPRYYRSHKEGTSFCWEEHEGRGWGMLSRTEGLGSSWHSCMSLPHSVEDTWGSTAHRAPAVCGEGSRSMFWPVSWREKSLEKLVGTLHRLWGSGQIVGWSALALQAEGAVLELLATPGWSQLELAANPRPGLACVLFPGPVLSGRTDAENGRGGWLELCLWYLPAVSITRSGLPSRFSGSLVVFDF